jgi:hypothetical protein
LSWQQDPNFDMRKVIEEMKKLLTCCHRFKVHHAKMKLELWDDLRETIEHRLSTNQNLTLARYLTNDLENCETGGNSREKDFLPPLKIIMLETHPEDIREADDSHFLPSELQLKSCEF